jgi:hypothetical protein
MTFLAPLKAFRQRIDPEPVHRVVKCDGLKLRSPIAPSVRFLALTANREIFAIGDQLAIETEI